MPTSLSSPYFPAPTPRSARILLYVDFDGVLHHEAVYWHRSRGAYVNPQEAPGRTLFEWTHHLQRVLSDFSEVRLVLSSTWCIQPGYGKALSRLPEALRSQFIGGTFHRRFHGVDPWTVEAFRAASRARQILADVERRSPEHWFALDDDVADWPQEHRENLVACEGTTGLSSPSVREELRRKLHQASKLPKDGNG